MKGLTSMMQKLQTKNIGGQEEDELEIEPTPESRLAKEYMQYKKDTDKRWYIIETNNKHKLYWDILVITCAIYTTITVPIELCFAEINDYFDSFIVLHTLDVIVDIIFIIDIIVGFLTSYINTTTGD